MEKCKDSELSIPLFHSPAASPVTHKLLSRDCYHPRSNDDSDEKRKQILKSK